VIAAVAVLLLMLVARRAWARGLEARREKAGELRVEAEERKQDARRAEIAAEREREAAETSAQRADRLDPDVDTGGRRGLFRRGGDEDHEEDHDAEADADHETTANGDRRGLWDRIAHR
jgi:hypothetical protein